MRTSAGRSSSAVGGQKPRVADGERAGMMLVSCSLGVANRFVHEREHVFDVLPVFNTSMGRTLDLRHSVGDRKL